MKLIICGWYGTETLGDKAILGGISRSIGDLFEEKYICSIHPYLTEVTKSQMPELNDFDVIDFATTLDLIDKETVLIFGGGPLMAIHEVLDMLQLFVVTKQKGGTTGLAGVGIGPFGNKVLNKAIFHLIENSDFEIYRDMESLQTREKLIGFSNNAEVTEDPSLVWVTEVRDSILQKKGPIIRENNELILALRNFPFEQYAYKEGRKKGLKIQKRFNEKIKLVIKQAIEKDDIVIKPLPMCTNFFGDDDRWYYRNLLEGDIFNEKIDRTLIQEELSPEKYLESFMRCNSALTMRFHSVVFSLGTKTPQTAIDYTLGRGKVNALIQKHSLSKISLLSNESISLSEILQKSKCNEEPSLSFKNVIREKIKAIL